MSVTFGNNPAGSNRDLVRILVNDTTGMLSDETINYFIASEPNVWYAAAMAAEMLGQIQSAEGSLTVGDLTKVSWIGAAGYRNMAKTLRARGSRGAVPFAGGLTVSDKDTEKTDSQRVKPAFSIGMHDDPATDST